MVKLVLSLLAVSLLSFGYTQSTLSGVWLSNGGDEDTPKVIEFKSNGQFVIFENDEEHPEKPQEIIEGSYYYEDDKDLLVTITWYGSQAKTTRYNYKIIDGKLELSQFYPEKSTWIYEREVALSEQF